MWIHLDLFSFSLQVIANCNRFQIVHSTIQYSSFWLIEKDQYVIDTQHIIETFWNKSRVPKKWTSDRWLLETPTISHWVIGFFRLPGYRRPICFCEMIENDIDITTIMMITIQMTLTLMIGWLVRNTLDHQSVRPILIEWTDDTFNLSNLPLHTILRLLPPLKWQRICLVTGLGSNVTTLPPPPPHHHHHQHFYSPHPNLQIWLD